jgi:putative endonuclease
VTTLELGQDAEQKALNYLLAQGLKCVTRNYRCRLGEIDLIMRDKEYLVFIEVRARVSSDYGGGIASITYAKRQKIIKTTSHYLLSNKITDKYPVRFDVISLDGAVGGITWVKDAFSVGY